MQSPRTHYFNEGPVITGLTNTGEYVAFEPARELVRGHGHSRLAAIANLNRAIEEAGEIEDREECEERLTGQNAIEAGWDHARAHREVA